MYLNAYWWKAVPNFGDAIAPLLLERFANVQSGWAPVAAAQVVSVGSVLEHIPSTWSGYVLGSGKLKEGSVISLPYARILALRGPLSAHGIPGDYAIGDPGIIADELVGLQSKLWDIGILAHWRDVSLVPKYLKWFPEAKVILPGNDPLEVIRQIGACRRLVTSSLHGMIVADAFGIPRKVEVSPALAGEGGDFKFRDYSESIRTPFVPGVMSEPNRNLVEDVKFAIYDAYKELESRLQ